MELVTQAEYARQRNYSRSSVCRWVKSGRISTHNKKINPEEADRQIAATESMAPHHQGRKAQVVADKLADNSKSGQHPLDLNPSHDKAKASLVLRHKLATTREREEKAAMAKMERQKIAGELVPVDQVQYVIKTISIVVRKNLESLPDQISHSLAACTSDANAIHNLLSDELRTVLMNISNAIESESESKQEQ